MCKGSRFPYPAVKAMGAVTGRVVPRSVFTTDLFVQLVVHLTMWEC